MVIADTKPWTEEEHNRMMNMKNQGMSYQEIGKELGRSAGSVRSRSRRLHSVDDGGGKPMKPRVYPRTQLKAAVFDIETTSFKAGGVDDHLICMCILPLDRDEAHTFKIKFEDRRDDRRLLNEAISALEGYDILIGHYISGFDLPWLLSRLAYHHQPLPKKRWLYFDTYYSARRMSIRADRKSMAFLCDFFRVEYTKTAILPVAWQNIDSPRKNEFDFALKEIVYHCETDVRSNRNLFDALYPLDRSMTSLPIMKK